ncbi:unnamed protein product [marine sediment metagenome]|uniref:Uncharacterized protein n=1 Tax=marine sediment metagenome TaxID=412755 RepID=X1ISL7_9ZZZZ
MLNQTFNNCNYIEENRDYNSFEGFLQSKMSTIILVNSIIDDLKAGRNNNGNKSAKGASVILTEKIIKKLTSIAEKFGDLNDVAEICVSFFNITGFFSFLDNSNDIKNTY